MSALAGTLAGIWGGALEGGPVVRVRVDIEEREDGLAATLRALDQGDEPIPSSAARWDGETLTLRFAAIGGAFEGRLEAPGRLRGQWRQGFGRFGVTLERGPDVETMLRRLRPPPLDAAGLEAMRAACGAPAMAAAARGPEGRRIDLATGRRSAAAEAPVGVEDLWHIGSITKSFTATLIARLVEAGRLSWETPLAEAAPDLAEGMRPSYREATLPHLLSHRAGLRPNIPFWRAMFFPAEGADPRESRRAYARIALGQRPVGRPGERFVYSNSGYVVAGLLAEAATGAPWERLILEHLAAPMGLESLGFGPPGAPGALTAPVGHSGGWLRAGPRPHPPGRGQADNPAVIGPAGRIHIRLGDLCRYLAQHRDRAPYLSRESWDRLHTPPFGGAYALGWAVFGEGRLGHAGSNTLWCAEARFDRRAGHVAAAAANDGRLRLAAPQVSTALWAAEAASLGA